MRKGDCDELLHDSSSMRVPNTSSIEAGEQEILYVLARRVPG